MPLVLLVVGKSPEMAWDLAVPESLGRMAIVGIEDHVSPMIDIR